jgi:hypothetical protein
MRDAFGASPSGALTASRLVTGRNVACTMMPRGALAWLVVRDEAWLWARSLITASPGESGVCKSG